MTLLEQALQAKADDRFEEWFLALSPERKEVLKMELALEDYRARQPISDEDIHYSPERGWYVGPKETK